MQLRAQLAISKRPQDPRNTTLSICNVNHSPTVVEYSALKTLARNEFNFVEGTDYVDVEGLCRLLRTKLGIEGLDLPEYLVEYILSYTPTLELRRIRATTVVYARVISRVLRARLLLAIADTLNEWMADSEDLIPSLREAYEQWREQTALYKGVMARNPEDSPDYLDALEDQEEEEELLWKRFSGYVWGMNVISAEQPRVDRRLFSYDASPGIKPPAQKLLWKPRKLGLRPLFQAMNAEQLQLAQRFVEAGQNPNVNHGLAAETAVATLNVDFLRLFQEHGLNLDGVVPVHAPWLPEERRFDLTPANLGTHTHGLFTLLVKAVLRPLGETTVRATSNSILRLQLLVREVVGRASPSVRIAPDTSSLRGEPAGHTLLKHLASGEAEDGENRLVLASSLWSAALDAGYDPNAVNGEGATFMHVITNPSQGQIVRETLAGQTRKGRIPVFVHATDKYGRTPAFYAAAASDGELLRELKTLGADLNARDLRENTPFLFGLVDTPKKGGGTVDSLLNQFRILHGAGCNPFALDDQGRTAFGYTKYKVEDWLEQPQLLKPGEEHSLRTFLQEYSM